MLTVSPVRSCRPHYKADVQKQPLVVRFGAEEPSKAPAPEEKKILQSPLLKKLLFPVLAVGSVLTGMDYHLNKTVQNAVKPLQEENQTLKTSNDAMSQQIEALESQLKAQNNTFSTSVKALQNQGKVLQNQGKALQNQDKQFNANLKTLVDQVVPTQLTDLIPQVAPSTVLVAGPKDEQGKQSVGSGFFVQLEDGTIAIITNGHVLEPMPQEPKEQSKPPIGQNQHPESQNQPPSNLQQQPPQEKNVDEKAVEKMQDILKRIDYIKNTTYAVRMYNGDDTQTAPTFEAKALVSADQKIAYSPGEIGDLALLIPTDQANLPPNIQPIQLRDLVKHPLKAGEEVFAIGNPMGLRDSITTGHISHTSRRAFNIKNHLFIQHDAAINPGNSGGGLFTARMEKGKPIVELVGINTLRLGTFDNLGLAIRGDFVQKFIEGADGEEQKAPEDSKESLETAQNSAK